MAFLNARDRIAAEQRARISGPEADYGFADAFEQSLYSAVRSLPTQSLFRGLKGALDSSEAIDPFEANSKFNLQGEAAFQEGEEVTIEMAKDRAQDQSFLIREAHVQGMYAQKSPTLSVIANLTGGLAAGFFDPTILAINAGASALMTKGINSAITTTRVGRSATNALGAYNPNAGRAVIQMFATKNSASLNQVLLREGAENFLASVAEETVNFAGIGEDRLARKITAQESLQNILLGTTIGTGFGTVLDKAGRRGMVNRFNRLFGDNAPDTVYNQNLIMALEAKAGIPHQDFRLVQADEDTFAPKTWHKYSDDGIDYVDRPQQGKFYIPMDGDQMHSVSNRGDAVVATSNVSHAQNLGKKVKELDVNELRILRPADFVGVDGRQNKVKGRIINSVIEDFTDSTTKEQLLNVYSKLIGDQIQIAPKKLRKNVLKLLRQELMDKNTLEDIFEMMESVATRGGVDYNIHGVVKKVLGENGFDGYTFRGRNHKGMRAYTGIALTPEGAGKAKVRQEFDVAEPDFVAREQYDLARQQAMQEYGEKLQKIAGRVTEPDEPITVKETPERTPIEKIHEPKNSTAELYQYSPETKAAIDSHLEELELKKAETDLTPEELETYDLLQMAKNNQDFGELVDKKLLKVVEDFEACLRK